MTDIRKAAEAAVEALLPFARLGTDRDGMEFYSRPDLVPDDCTALHTPTAGDLRRAADAYAALRAALAGEREGEIQKEKANETAETVIRMELQGSQQRIVSARPELVADHGAAVPQGVSLCADRGEAVTPSSGLVERLRKLETEAVAAPWFAGGLDGDEDMQAATTLCAKDEEIARLTERLGPRGLEVVMIDGSGHYVSEKVAATIRRLEETLVLSERQTTEQTMKAFAANARAAAFREAAEIVRQFAPECSGPDYGMASEEERKQMRRNRDRANDFATALLKEAENKIPSDFQKNP